MIIVLIIVSVLFIMYIAYIKKQLRDITHQLTHRHEEKTREQITVELIDKDLNKLVENINNSLKEEEELRIKTLRDEKRFKELIANISHDLRTPLTAIKGYTQLLDKSELTSNQEEKLKIIKKHTDELEGLIKSFFEYSYLITTEEVELELEELNLTNLVAEGVTEYIDAFEKQDMRVHFNPESSVKIIGDKEKVTRIIRNLTRNCTQHASGDVYIEVKKEDKAVMIFKNKVKNPQNINVERLFDRYYTADKARQKSTGLGLSIVKLLTEQLGGKVSAELRGDNLSIKIELPLINMQ